VLDEPTTGLDVITQAHVINEIRRLRDELGASMVYVTHDLAVLAQIADRVAVMYAGEIVEEGPVRQILSAPAHPYTRTLIAAIPDHAIKTTRAKDVGAPAARRTAAVTERAPMLEVKNLRAEHKSRAGAVVAASDVSFQIRAGCCVALVGESGSGKTTVARTIAGLHPASGGELLLNGASLPSELRRRSRSQRRAIQMIFQNPTGALNPRETIRAAITRGLKAAGTDTTPRRCSSVDELLDVVRLPGRVANRYPRELSGGERQRVAIARALAVNPRFLICDEITSALDVSVQAAVLNLLNDLRDDLGIGLLFITHDLGVVAEIADEVLVLRLGLVAEHSDTTTVLTDPSDEYTRELVTAAPSLSAALGGFAPTDNGRHGLP
jgi:peptide/nickel transport system ATP-binding protein